MTTLRTAILGAVLALGLPSTLALAADGWGASYSFNAISPASNHLVYMKTTLVPGRLPSLGNAGPLFIWPGISNSTSDLIQTTLNAYSNNGNTSYCGATTSQWCAEASVFNGGQTNGKAAPIDPDDRVTIEYKLESDNTTWTQTVTSEKLGRAVSTLQSKSGLLQAGGMGFATEAQNESYTIDTQYYLCTEARLAAPDPTWGSKSGGANGANHGATGTGSGPGTAKNVHTPDNGLTWLVDLITLPAMNPQGTQSSPPAYDCSGSSTGSGGTMGKGGNTGSGGRNGSGGTVGKGGSTGGDGGLGGGGGSTRVDSGAGSGGTTRNDASFGAGGTVGSGGTTAAGAAGTTGGAAGSGGTVKAGAGGATGLGGIKGTGGSNPGAGGSMAAGNGGASGGASRGGSTGSQATGGSATTAAVSSGCGCVVGSLAPCGGLSAFLILAGLALLARRSRNRAS